MFITNGRTDHRVDVLIRDTRDDNLQRVGGWFRSVWKLVAKRVLKPLTFRAEPVSDPLINAQIRTAGAINEVSPTTNMAGRQPRI